MFRNQALEWLAFKIPRHIAENRIAKTGCFQRPVAAGIVAPLSPRPQRRACTPLRDMLSGAACLAFPQRAQVTACHDFIDTALAEHRAEDKLRFIDSVEPNNVAAMRF